MPHRMLAGLACAATYVLRWGMGHGAGARVAAPALCKEAPVAGGACRKENLPAPWWAQSIVFE
jgi:hypothetical protein